MFIMFILDNQNAFFVTVQGKIRVIRGCGYIKHEQDDGECYIKTGTKDVHITHCSCTTSACNLGHIGYNASAMLIIFSALFSALLRIK